MARKSTKENKNIYQRTREGLGLTRECDVQVVWLMAEMLPHPFGVILM